MNFTDQAVSSAMPSYQDCPIQPGQLLLLPFSWRVLYSQGHPQGPVLNLRLNLYRNQTSHTYGRVLSSSPASVSQQHWGFRHVGPTNSNFFTWWRFEPQSSCLLHEPPSQPLPLTFSSLCPAPSPLCLIKPLSRRFLLSLARLFCVDNCGNISPDRRIFHTLCLINPQITT